MEISLNRKIDTWPKMEHAVTCFCSGEGDWRVKVEILLEQREVAFLSLISLLKFKFSQI